MVCYFSFHFYSLLPLHPFSAVTFHDLSCTAFMIWEYMNVANSILVNIALVANTCLNVLFIEIIFTMNRICTVSVA